MKSVRHGLSSICRYYKILVLAVMFVLTATASQAVCAAELKVVQQPTFWIVGQWTRIVVETPDDCGRLDVIVPKQLTLLDRWPFRLGDATQRFYFRATAPVKSEELVFKSAEHKLALPVRVLSWQEVLNERFEREITSGTVWSGKLKLPRLLPIDGKDELKSGLSFLTPAELQRQRESFRRNLKGHARDALPQVKDLRKLFYSLPSTA